MTNPFRTRRIVLFAASTAIVAGGALLPGTAFAAAPATAPAVVADGGQGGSTGNESTLQYTGDDGAIVVHPGTKHPGKKHPGKHRPGKSGSPESPNTGPGGKPPVIYCIVAPCPQPGEATDPGIAGPTS